jgi:acyl-CoA thioester hydrolase
MIETHRSFANMWECDENNHINVQFFMKRFEEAYAVFCTLDNHSSRLSNSVTHRHLRFHREIRAGESQLISSGVIKSGEHKGCLIHIMTNAVSGEVCTTALDCLSSPMACENFVDDTYLSLALPRGVPSKPEGPFESNSLIQSGEAMISNYNIIRSHDLDPEGKFLPSRMISMFTDGAPHIWEKAGITTNWLNENGFGRVAVEMRLDPITNPPEGEALRVVSRAGALEGRTFLIDHQIETVAEQTIIATGSVRALVMDLTTRKAVQLPEGFTGSLTN